MKKKKEDCILFNPDFDECRGLNKLYCEKGDCGFFKSVDDYIYDKKNKSYKKVRK